MKLSVKDRVLLPGIFTENRDSITEAAVQRSIRELIRIGKEEADYISLKAATGGYVWDAKKGLDKEFELSASQINYLKDSIYTLSKAGGVTQNLLPLCEKLNAL